MLIDTPRVLQASLCVAILSCVFSVQSLLLHKGTTKKLALTKPISAIWISLSVCIRVLCEVLYDFITCTGNSQHLELSHYRRVSSSPLNNHICFLSILLQPSVITNLVSTFVISSFRECYGIRCYVIFFD